MELKYFDGRGGAEGSRLLAAAAGKYSELKDTRFPVDPSKFPTGGVDAASPDFAAARDAGDLKANMNRAPVLIVDGVALGQSSAIERLIAKRFGLYGSTDIEGALIDMIVEHLADIKKSYQDTKKKNADDVPAWFKDKLPEWLTKLEATLGSDGYAVGSALSWADVKLYQFGKEYFDDAKTVEEAISSFPKITASIKAVTSNAGVAEYLLQRKETAF